MKVLVLDLPIQQASLLILASCLLACNKSPAIDSGHPPLEPIEVVDIAITTVTIAEEAVGRMGFGDLISSTPDLDGDGFHDVLIGDPYVYSPEVPYPVYVMSGQSRGTITTDNALATLVTYGAFDVPVYFGGSGDLDGDGFDDYVFMDYDGVEFAYVVSGGSAGLIPPDDIISSFMFDSNICVDDYSTSASILVADVSGDDVEDLMVSCWAWPNVPESGAADYLGIFRGPLAPTLGSWDADLLLFHQGNDVAAFGAESVAAGDMDGDGVSELAVTAYHDERWPGGAIFLISGTMMGQIDRYDLEDVLHGSGMYYPAAVGDVNQDGYADLGYGYSTSQEGVTGIAIGPIVGAVSRDARQVATIPGPPNAGDASAPLPRGGELDGDGWPDIIVQAVEYYGYDPSGDEERYYVVHGPLEGSIDLSHQRWIPAWGWHFTFIEDIDGDGLQDMAYQNEVWDPNHSNYESAVFLIPGTAL